MPITFTFSFKVKFCLKNKPSIILKKISGMCSLIFITVLLLIFMFNITTYCMSETFINFTKDDKFFGSILYRVQHVSLREIPHNHVLVDTGRKLNVHKTFIRHPGRLLNVFYTFNLRPVSTGV